MNHSLINSSEPVTLVGGGDASVDDLKTSVLLAPRCIAADGGLRLVLAAGLEPEAVIGDFDSVNGAELGRISKERQFHIAEQDSTDFDKALRSIAAPLVIAVGFTGARIDHQLAVLNVIARRADRLVLVLGRREIICHLPREITLPTMAGDVVSLMPMRAVSGCSDGLEWPIDGLDFAPDAQVGTSNRAIGTVKLRMNGPGMLAIIPRTRLCDLVSACLAVPDAARWPAPA